ncbi:hypothetical protein [Vannielia litorea]|uniref:Uncharacterized protein n=1 Tax=Vannielia litorea TaxID=1217970 RepID=A0A1N6EDL8_9RHOB|nr:hypothetical protein [Vannielia litorea]SIN81041.1 hypothetical protein SAMN05444002_0629 [Vannielia litorea]
MCALAGLLTLAATPALAAPYACTVAAFTTFDTDDTAFIAANHRKTYDLAISGDTITLAMHSPDFEPYTATYIVARREMLSTIAQRRDRESVDLLVLPPRPAERIAEDGGFTTTLTVAGSHYANSWLLACTAR